MIYIVIPVHNRVDFTIACIDSLLHQSYRAFEVIVVDDGSSDHTADRIRQRYPEVTLLYGDGNLWWSGATNKGVQYAIDKSASDDDFIVCLNNDLVVKEDYLQQLLSLNAKNPKSIIGSLAVDIDTGMVDYSGSRWNPYWATIRPVLQKCRLSEAQEKSDALETSLLPGRGILIPVRCFKEIGLFDFETFPQYAADNDFTLRARNNGYWLGVSTKAVVYSHVNATGLKMDKKRNIFVRLKMAYTSIRSPLNLKVRYSWAKKHAKSPPLFYFMIDFLRITKSLIFK